MKKCPFCAEQIQDEAIKCKHCGEFIDESIKRKLEEIRIRWYFRTSFIILAVLTVGPLALPLIWLRPGIAKGWKIGLTLGVLVLTWLTWVAAVDSLHVLKQYGQLVQGM